MTDCPLCEANRLRADTAEQDTRNTELALRKERQATQALKAMVADKHRSSPRAAEVQEVIEYWAYELGHTRIKVATDDKRADAVRKAFGWGFTIADLKQAVDGLRRYPYVWSNRGRMRYGLRDQRHDDLKMVLKDTATIERFQGYALESEPDERMVWLPARVLDRMHERDAAFRRQLEWLAEEGVLAQAALEGLAARVEAFEGSPDRPKLRLVERGAA